jgi:hypothetical protein
MVLIRLFLILLFLPISRRNYKLTSWLICQLVFSIAGLILCRREWDGGRFPSS